ncbi:MAG: hypothetical protein OET21_05350 [Desulfobacterales bacterium]|nr:hypothetical protein [Desulfobacterales bacterium]MDH3826817.1 hypothetical protein [Desulfobacterales bacterium]MDH3876987.1 hypothetical protein [Desulfobacterales bacterium]
MPLKLVKAVSPLDRILNPGSEKVRPIARPMLESVRRASGISRQ